ncbi:unnamed protein product, partial [Oppiella nova]
YGLGSNYYGSLGLGDNRYVNEIQVIDRLCHKNITQYFNGLDFVLGLTQHNCLYGWGCKGKGQLGIAAMRNDVLYVDPELIDLNCGNFHTMILTSDCCVYVWGDNMYGQLGCGPDSDIRKGDTYRVNFNPNHEIKSIYCCYYSSFGITSEGQVYSWGRNSFYNLGHNSSDNIWEPQLIADMTGIKTICSAGVVSEVNEYKYLFEELHSLGSGAFGEVFVAKKKFDGQEFAVKKIKYEDYQNLFECYEEMQNLIKVRSEYCVQYMGQWSEDGVYYIQTELCSNSLENILQHKPQVFGRQPEEPMNSIEFYISCHIFKEILECVQYLHELNPPVIHRDLKPDNILVAKTVRNGRYLKVADFGLASFQSRSSGSHTTGVGTLQYMAPEVRLQTKYTPKADIYSLAFPGIKYLLGI